MRGATNVPSFAQRSARLHLTIWLKSGEQFAEAFDLQTTTFADVKRFAIEKQREQPPTDEPNEHKLISLGSRRIVDENKNLSELNVRDGDEFLLINRKRISSTTPEKNLLHPPAKADAMTIEQRTRHLPVSSRSFSSSRRSRLTDEFRTDLLRILTLLIETSQKLLWFHPDAENIFRHAEEILRRSAGSATETEVVGRTDLVKSLVEMGFTQRQAQLGLRRTNNDLQATTDLLINQPDLADDQDEEPLVANPHAQLRLFDRHGPFVSVRKFREANFRLNSNAVRMLKEMCFTEDQIGKALRLFNNNTELACEFLLSDENQQKRIEQNRSDQLLDPHSPMFQSIIRNAVVQRTLNIPKTFFVLLQLTENVVSITNLMNDPDIAQMLVEISRIYHSENLAEDNSTGENFAGARRPSDETTSSDDE